MLISGVYLSEDYSFIIQVTIHSRRKNASHCLEYTHEMFLMCGCQGPNESRWNGNNSVILQLRQYKTSK